MLIAQPTPHIFLAVANAPHLLQSFLTYGGDLRHKTKLSPRLRELAIMTVGQVTGLQYEVVHHKAYARAAGVSDEQIAHLADFETSGLFTEQDRSAMRYASEAAVEIHIRDSTWQDLRRFLDDREAIELVLNVAWYVAATRILGPLNIAIEDWAPG